MLLVDALPQLQKEIRLLLDQAGESQLSAQLEDLSIVDRCRCGDDFCSSFYTAPKPAGAYGKGHRSISLEPSKGMIILDVVDEKVVQIEVLYRDEVRETLDKLMS
jgi:hypothetical protein